jgi:hypothetical protein
VGVERMRSRAWRSTKLQRWSSKKAGDVEVSIVLSSPCERKKTMVFF